MTSSRLPFVLPLLVIASFAQRPTAADESDPFFKKGEIPRLELTLSEENYAKLKAAPRVFVAGTLLENGKTTRADVMVKLKGAAGSFREIDDRPALTLRVGRVLPDQRFHGLEKFHLNNSVQDDTWLHEWLGSELFNAAGVPAARVTHARVWLNGRDLGFYVLKEGFDRRFLSRHFPDPSGNLYDGGFCQDVDAELEKDGGAGPDDRTDLKAVLAAASAPDLAVRWKTIAETVDVKAFLTFAAMELMVGHWDGYSQNRNNYRLYFDPASKKARFLPHGMDQIFGDANASILDTPGALVAAAIMKSPEWRAAYRKRVKELLPLFVAERLAKKLAEVQARMKPVLAAMDPELARGHADRVRGLVERLEAREKSLREQAALPEPKPLVFAKNVPVRILNWRSMSECEDARLQEVKIAGERAYLIETGKSGRCIASWRRNVLLSRGRYRLSASVQVKELQPLAEPGAPGVAAGIRIASATRTEALQGSAFWKATEFEFEVTEEKKDVELVVESRASRGAAWFKVDSLKLTKLP